MRKKILGMLLVLCMVFTMVPATAFALESYNVWVGGTQVTSVNDSGEGWSYTPAAGEIPQTLTLTNASITTWSSFADKPVSGMTSLFGIYAEGDLNIVLVGSNSVDISSSSTTTGYNCAIYVAGDIMISGGGSLTAKGGSIDIDTNYRSCGISSSSTTIDSATVTAIAGTTLQGAWGTGFYGSLTINNGGTMIAAAEESEYSSYGAKLITCVINDGTLTATGGDAFYSYGLSIDISVTINGGTVTASSGSVGEGGFSRAMGRAPSFGASYTPRVTAGESSTVNNIVASPDNNTYRDNKFVKIESVTSVPFSGTVTISGALKFNETLTATVSGDNNTGTLSYQWKRGATNLGTDATYTTVLADIGQTITCEVTSDVQTGTISGSSTEAIAKADGLEVSGVSVTNCTTEDNDDGTLIGVTTDMQYKMSGDAGWTDGTGITSTGLSNGEYKVRVKETETHNPGAESTFTIGAYSPTPTYGISLDKTGTHTFAGANAGYGEQGALTVQVSNTGNQPTGPLTVALSGANSGSFTLNKTSIDSIAASGNDTFTVKPNTGLAAGVYTATVTVEKASGNANDITAQSFHISFTVTGASIITFDANSGTVTPTTAATSLEGKLASLPTPTRSGSYRFDGWFTAVSGGTQVTTDTVFTGNDTIYARWTYLGGGGSGGGGSNNNNNNNPSNITVTTPPAEQPNNPTQGEIKVSGKVDQNNNVTITITDRNVADVFNKAIADAKKNGNEENGITLVLNVDTGNQKANTMTVNLPKTVQDAIISKKIVSTVVVVDNPDILIGMDLTAVEEINKQAKTDVNLTAAKADNNGLTDEAKEAVGSRPVFVLKVNYGSGRQVKNFGEGSITVEIPYTLGENEEADNICAVYIDDNGKVEWLTDSVYDRTKKVVRFSTKHFSTYGIGYKQANPEFTDITNHWAKESIAFAVRRGLFSGTSATTFSPDSSMTRGMFVTALGRLAEVDTEKYTKTSFSDVKNDAYYMPYIEWASKYNIVTGIEDGKFAPDQIITREQMAVIMNNYAKIMGVALPKVNEVSTFADNAKIGTWAKDAVEKVQLAGIISGKSNNVFDPQGMATRAEVSTMLKRFMELAIDTDTAQR